MNRENLSAIAAKLCVSEQPRGCHPLHLTISERAAEKLDVGPEEKGVIAALERLNNNNINNQITLFVSVRITGLEEDTDLQEHEISLWCTPQFLDHYKIMKNDLYFIRTVEVFPIQKVIFEVTNEEAFRWTNKVKFGAELIVSICQGNVLIRQGDVFLAPFSTLLLQDKDFKENMVFDIRVIECHPVKQGILTVNTEVVFIFGGKNNQAQSPVEQSLKNTKACTPCISDFSQPLNGLRSKSMNGGMLKGHSDAASASRENLRSGCVQFVSHKSFTVQPTVLMKENLLECMVRSQDENSSFDPLYVIGMSRCLMLEYGIFDGAIVYVSTSGPENAGDQVPVFVQFKNSRCLRTFPRSGHSGDHGSDVDSLPDEEIQREDTNTERSTTVNSNVRLAQVKMLKEEFNMSSDVYVSPLLLFNLKPSPTTVPMQICVLEKFSNRQSDDSVRSVSSSWDAKIPFAKEVQISLVNSPNYSPLSSYTDAIKNYFHSVTRVVSVGDVFAVKSEDDPQFYSSLSDDIESRHPFIYFKVIRIEPELPGHRTFIVDDVKTTLIQVGSVHSYIPSQLEVYLSRHRSLRYWDHPKLGGLEASSDRLESLLLPHLSSSYEANRDILPCILLTGPSGVGKSAVVKCVARKLGLKVVRVSCSNLSADTPSATEARLRRVMESATFYSPCVLLLQQIHVLGVEREGNLEDTRVAKGFQDMLSLLVPAEYPVVVIATTAQPKLMSEDIQQCFLHTLNMEVPSESERADMIGSLLSDTDVASDIDVASIAQRTAGFVLGDFLALLVQVKKCAINRICEYCGVCPTMERERDVRSAGVAVDQSDVDRALEVLQSTHSHAIGTPKIPDVRWEDIGGLAEVREEILDTVQLPLQHPELLAAGLRRSGVLLYGPPGSGKTLLAKAVATECSLNFLSVKGPELINKYVGQSEENVREVFSRARDASPCVIFFDELDSLAPNRGRSGDSGGVMDRVVSQMLAELDGLHRSLDVFVIGATNRPDLLDPALLRPGRFDKPLYLGVSSDKATQVKILQALTRKFSLDPALSLEEVAADCPMTLTGADFYALCSDAMLNALKRKINRLERGEAVDQGTVTVLQADFTAALSKLTPSVSGEDLQRYEQLKISLSANT